MQRLGAHWAAVTRGEGGVGHAEMGKMVALGPSWVLGRGVALRAGPARAGPMREKERAGLGCCWVGFGCGFVFYFSLSISFLF